MTAATALALVLATAAGLGVWFPLRSVGGRLFLGAAAIPVLLSVVHFSTRLPLSWIAPAIACLGLPGLVRLAAAAFGTAPKVPLQRWGEVLLNPAVLLPVAAAVLMAVRGVHSYSPYSWDEFASWLYWPREAFAADGFVAPGMGWQRLMYTQGWPMALLYPQLFFDRFDLARAIPVGLIWHAALYGLIFDALRAHLRRAIPDVREATIRLGGWLAVLVLLAAQATWTLLPQLLLIEPPQIFIVAAVFGFLFLGLGQPEDRDRCIAAAGCMLAAGYLVKVTVLGAVPAAILAMLAMPGSPPGGMPSGGREWREIGGRLVRLLAPVAIAYLWWSAIKPFHPGPSCLSDPFSLPTVNGASPAAHAADTALRIAGGIAAYLKAYKLPLTLAAAAGFLAAFSRRTLRPVAAGILLYAVVYALALVPLYAWCYGNSIELEKLDSLQRYIRVPLRIVHLFGPVFLVLVVAEHARRWRGRMPDVAARAAVWLLAAGVAATGVFQVHAIDASLRNVVSRDREPAASVARIDKTEHDIRALVRTIDAAGLKSPHVAMIAQGTKGFDLRIARYFALSDRRGGDRFRFKVYAEYNWAPKATDLWTAARTPAALAAQFETQDVVWPLKTDPWVRAVLARLVPAGDCAAHPEAYFLLRTPSGPSPFRCVAKGDASGAQ